MDRLTTQPLAPRWYDPAARWFFRLAPGLRLPASWWEPRMARAQAARPPIGNPLHIEVVSHCWNYSHLLAYQLSSLVLAPPQRAKVTMTVCYCAEDRATVDLLAFFERHSVAHVTWRWLGLPREELLRRAIGRDRAGRTSTADWVWFTDCDLVFAAGCVEALAEALVGRFDALVFPREERCTPMLKPSDDMLLAAARSPRLVAIDASRFHIERPSKATGPLQIARGDLVREFGYCGSIRCYQTPTTLWRKTYEDRAFRWLWRTDGHAIDVPGVYRIKHVEKGRYHGPGLFTRLRSFIRRTKERARPDQA